MNQNEFEVFVLAVMNMCKAAVIGSILYFNFELALGHAIGASVIAFLLMD